MNAALDLVLDRITEIERDVVDRFPLYADPDNARWTTTRRGSWTGGFWAGLLWLRAGLSGTGADRHTAREWSRRLLPRVDDDTDTRAMTFWYGAGVGGRWLGDSEANAVAAAGAQAVAAAALPGPGLVPVGSAFGGGLLPRLGVDSLAAVIALLDAAELPDAAVAHARAAARLLVSPSGVIAPQADLAARRPGPAGPVWARGQAWGLLGFAVAADRFGAEFRPVAARVANRWLAAAGSGVPPAVLGVAQAPVDTSAAVIAAAGFWTLGDLETAASIVDAVLAGYLRPDGALVGGCYRLDDQVACAHELIWGTYFLTALLAVMTDRMRLPGW